MTRGEIFKETMSLDNVAKATAISALAGLVSYTLTAAVASYVIGEPGGKKEEEPQPEPEPTTSDKVHACAQMVVAKGKEAAKTAILAAAETIRENEEQGRTIC